MRITVELRPRPTIGTAIIMIITCFELCVCVPWTVYRTATVVPCGGQEHEDRKSVAGEYYVRAADVGEGGEQEAGCAASCRHSPVFTELTTSSSLPPHFSSSSSPASSTVHPPVPLAA